jgi:hypothetical protein
MPTVPRSEIPALRRWAIVEVMAAVDVPKLELGAEEQEQKQEQEED